MTKPTSRTRPLAATDAKALTDLVHKVITGYRGPAGDLEAALGMLMVGRYLGWRPLYILHSKKTVNKYEAILGIEVQNHFEADGPDAHRASGYQLANSRPSFWKVVSGEDAIDRGQRQRLE